MERQALESFHLSLRDRKQASVLIKDSTGGILIGLNGVSCEEDKSSTLKGVNKFVAITILDMTAYQCRQCRPSPEELACSGYHR
jgi:hypothetical protein